MPWLLTLGTATTTTTDWPHKQAHHSKDSDNNKEEQEWAEHQPLDTSMWHSMHSHNLTSPPAWHQHQASTAPPPLTMQQHTHMLLVGDPDDTKFNTLALQEQQYVEWLCGLMLGGNMALPDKLPGVLCQWWCGIKLKADLWPGLLACGELVQQA